MAVVILSGCLHDNVIKWKHFPSYWPLWGNPPVNSPHKGQWRGALMFSLIYVWTNAWASNRDACDLRRHCTRYDVTVMRILYHPELKPHQNPFVYIRFVFCLVNFIFYKICEILTMLCSKVRKYSTVKMGVISEDFVRFYCKIPLKFPMRTSFLYFQSRLFYLHD